MYGTPDIYGSERLPAGPGGFDPRALAARESEALARLAQARQHGDATQAMEAEREIIQIRSLPCRLDPLCDRGVIAGPRNGARFGQGTIPVPTVVSPGALPVPTVTGITVEGMAISPPPSAPVRVPSARSAQPQEVDEAFFERIARSVAHPFAQRAERREMERKTTEHAQIERLMAGLDIEDIPETAPTRASIRLTPQGHGGAARGVAPGRQAPTPGRDIVSEHRAYIDANSTRIGDTIRHHVYPPALSPTLIAADDMVMDWDRTVADTVASGVDPSTTIRVLEPRRRQVSERLARLLISAGVPSSIAIDVATSLVARAVSVAAIAASSPPGPSSYGFDDSDAALDTELDAELDALLGTG
jgi:hypothetical protein